MQGSRDRRSRRRKPGPPDSTPAGPRRCQSPPSSSGAIARIPGSSGTRARRPPLLLLLYGIVQAFIYFICMTSKLREPAKAKAFADAHAHQSACRYEDGLDYRPAIVRRVSYRIREVAAITIWMSRIPACFKAAGRPCVVRFSVFVHPFFINVSGAAMERIIVAAPGTFTI